MNLSTSDATALGEIVWAERELVVEMHRTMADVPTIGIRIDATRPVADVVDSLTPHHD